MDAKSERLKERYTQQYQAADKAVKKSARADKREYIDDLAKQAQATPRKGDQRTVYRVIRKIYGKYPGIVDTPVADKQGPLLTSEEEIDSLWAEHFSEDLKRDPPTTDANIQEAEQDLAINTDSPKKEHIMLAIKSLKNRKAPCKDYLNAELFKASPEMVAKILLRLF